MCQVIESAKIAKYQIFRTFATYSKYVAMKYLIRAVKYFIYFSLLTTVIVTVLVLIGAVEGNIDSIFNGGTDALWKIALFFALVSAVYPKLGFINRDIPVDRDLDQIRDEVVGFFRERRYELESETPDRLTFRIRGIGGRLSKMYEDRIILTRRPGGYEMEGLRKDVLRLATGFEHRFHTSNEE